MHEMYPARVAYLGDTSLPGPASYLAGIMTHHDLPFVHVRTDQAPTDAALGDDIGLYVLSDYPSGQLGSKAMARLCERVEAGAGLLMLGGWESYHGLEGHYDRTPLAELLPVEILGADDRRNVSQLCLVRACGEHEILADLPLDRPPSIGGYNELRARRDATVVLEGERYEVRCDDGHGPARFTAVERFPLLVASARAPGPLGAGRRACLATDVAPHWVGGFVDWGDERLTVRMGEDFVEVGNWYARFFGNLLRWCLGRERP